MKKLLFLFAFAGLFAFAANAQTKKACCAAKGASGEKVSCTAATDVDKAASADVSIVKQVSNTGEVSYARKEVCPMSGKVSFTSVEFCTKTSKFVNVSPSEKAACTKSASATKVASTEKKAACCANGANKACCKPGEKAAATETQTSGDAKVKLVKGENEQ